MPIPEDHLQRLEEDLSAQEHWLRTLRRHIAGLQDEVLAHEMIVALGRDQSLLGVLGNLYDRPELFERASNEPRAFFVERSVRIPDDAAVTVKTVTVNRDLQRRAVEARFVTAALKYGVGWSPNSGFYVISESPGTDAEGEQAWRPGADAAREAVGQLTVTVSVFEKNGLCRGPAIGNASFYIQQRGYWGIENFPLTATSGPPLSPPENVYTVELPPPGRTYFFLVTSPGHHPWDFLVNPGERHEVWLERQ